MLSGLVYYFSVFTKRIVVVGRDVGDSVWQGGCFVQNPDGSLAQSAMMQSALQKERRELKQAQREAECDSVPRGLNNPWIDPMPDGLLLRNTESFYSVCVYAVFPPLVAYGLHG